jgi:hypothetical protein
MTECYAQPADMYEEWINLNKKGYFMDKMIGYNKPPEKVEPPKIVPPAPPTPPKDMIAYLHWKSDAWRNVAFDLYTSIQSKDNDAIQGAVKHYEDVKKFFPFRKE